MSVNFHQPQFDQNIKDKIGCRLEVFGETGQSIKHLKTDYLGCHAISSSGFPSKVEGTHVFVTQIDEIVNPVMCIGWTSTPTFDSLSYAFPGCEMSGCCFWLFKGKMDPGDVRSVPQEISKKAKEVVSILTISENGKKITAEWIVDGTEGAVHDVTDEFKNGSDQIFPVVVLVGKDQQVQTIPFSQLKSTSPKIEELKKKLNNPVAVVPTSSTNNEENEKIIAELRQRVEEGNRKLLEQKNEQLSQKDKEIENMKRVLEAKDAQIKQLIESGVSESRMKEKQLELERAEHQKTRNLLHQSKQEMKDMEIHFLKQQLGEKESGQRRGREEVKVKQERDD